MMIYPIIIPAAQGNTEHPECQALAYKLCKVSRGDKQECYLQKYSDCYHKAVAHDNNIAAAVLIGILVLIAVGFLYSAKKYL